MKINIKKKLKSAGSTIKEMGSIDKKSLKNGSYSMGITAIVIAVLVVINLIVGQIPEKYKNLDVSSTKIYEISKTSKKLLKNMDHKVKFTVLANKEEADERIVTFLSKYSALSSKFLWNGSIRCCILRH